MLIDDTDTGRERNTFSAEGAQTRAQKAFKAIEGSELGFFQSNPWKPIFDFGPIITEQIAQQQGAAIAVELSDPFDFVDSERLVLLWDDTEIADGPRNFIEGDKLVIKIGPPKGKILSVWCTDSNIAVKVIKIDPPENAGAIQDAINAKDAAQKEKEGEKLNPIEKLVDKFISAQKTVAIVGVLVGGVVLYFYLKNKP